MSSGVQFSLLAVISASQVPPIDQCSDNPSFVQFRSELRRTIAARDDGRLLAIVADDVLVNFGGGEDKAAFIRHWALDSPQSSKVWKELESALSLGCALEEQARVSPSLGAQLGSGRDPFETFVALPGGVLRRQPNDRSKPIAKLKWHVLTIRQTWDGGAWVNVKLDDGRHGFIRRDQVRSPIDYRVRFEKTDGNWLMTGFVAGD